MDKIKIIIFAALCFVTPILSARQFTVVIDPGHGGKDPGSVGKTGQEKNINLNVAKKLGKLIESNHDDVKVIYTRTTDTYVTLQERPNIANQADGDLFISIHTNAAESPQAYGAETFTLGLSKSSANFEVAKRENSVLLLEEGNKETYSGFDPTSPDSYIMFEFMQSKYIDQSVEMAYYIQQEFVSVKRLDRGVRQAIFWVLHQVKMPSILVELGFITNPAEEKFLISNEGQDKLAKSIYNAFEKYKHEYDKRTVTQLTNDKNKTTGNGTRTNHQEDKAETEITDKRSDNTKVLQNDKPNKPDTPDTTNDTATTQAGQNQKPAIFRIQAFSTRMPLPDKHNEIRKIGKFQPIIHIEEKGWYKYFCTETTSWTEAQANLAKVKTICKDAFIVAFVNGKKVAVTDQMKQQQ